MNEFTKLGLSQPIVDAIEELGFSQPTPIQAQAIPRLLEDDTDMVGLAQTGTGKTAAFGLPLIELIEVEELYTQGLVLAPTRELCLQIAKDLQQFAKFQKKLKIHAVYGGTDISRQMREIRKGVHVIVATPGRLRDLMRRKAVQLHELAYLVLDEADEMLNMGFKEEIDDILKDTPEDKKTWLFSATMPSEVRRISRSYMTDPFELSVGTQNSANKDIDHQYVISRPSERYNILRRFLDYNPDVYGLVFCRTRMNTKDLADQLGQDGYTADALHGDMNQIQRDRVMQRFRTKRVKFLVATDVAARGIDVTGITHVFHYNIPEDISYYTHRSGRTGRAGQKGISLVLSHPRDMEILRRLERRVKIKFSQAHIPTGKEICEQRLMSYINDVKEVEVNDSLEEFLPKINEALEEMSKEDLIKHFSSISFNRFLKNYMNAPDFNPRARKRFQGKRLFINIGNMDLANIGEFLRYICDETGIPSSSIGRIDMQRTHTFFDVEKNVASTVMEKFKSKEFEGRALRVNEAGNSRGGGSGGGGRRDKGNSGGYRRNSGGHRHGGSGRRKRVVNRPRRDRR